ncbi:hypothetical protein HMPREF0367_00601 [[Eubacterium] cylindroides ATCC 27803]|uniref:Uncharacterized protein n=1 Tax=Faecalitalea cylindroides ATCC 27803 TaxID=649755 RepID=U2R6V8_9FIRM|nr:hypothetical protein HMPREF0367_00601 [[Eubacterium] cylindroides ATCC 27803] [Faecalitalea cylindroides ATCC 27803]
MSWENGSSLGLIAVEDRFKIIEKSERNKSKDQDHIKTLEMKEKKQVIRLT